MSQNVFHQFIASETAPEGHHCDGCDRLATRYLTAIGGQHHNQGGFFCQACGQEFARAVSRSMQSVTIAEGR